MFGDWFGPINWSRCSRYFYALLIVTSIALVACWFGGRGGIETNMLALMPPAERDPVRAQAAAQFDATLARQHIVLVGAADLATARGAAQDYAKALCASGAFANVTLQIDAQQQAQIAALYAPYRQRLLSETLRARIEREGSSAVFEHALGALYSPITPVSSAMLDADPLLTFFDFISAQNSARGNVQLRDGMLVAEHDGLFYVLLRLQLAGDPFAVSEQERVIPALDDAAAKARSEGARVLDIGAVRYAHEGVESASGEVNTIGTLSTVAVVAILLLVFRSPLPMIASLVASAVGFGVAIAACWLWFGPIHLLTLVFGSSLLGISIDHCLHFFADRMGAGADWRVDSALQRIFPGITVGLITTIIGYAGLYLTGFPGMQQMAVFSCAGLTGAYLTVIWFYPVWIKRPAGPARGPWLRYSEDLLHALRPKGRHWLWLLVIPLSAFSFVGLQRLHANDDIRTLQPVSPALRSVEKQVRDITGVQAGTQFFLVRGATPQATLEAEEALTAKLRGEMAAGRLGSYDALSRQVPSVARQRDNLARLRAALSDKAALARYIEEIGLEAKVLDNYADGVERAAAGPDLDLERWLASPAGQPWAHLWLGATSGNKAATGAGAAQGYATIVALYGVQDTSALAALERGDARWHFVDKGADISKLFQRYRERGMALIGMAYLLVYLFLCWRYGPLLALAVMLPTALAAALTIAGLGWLGQELNLFHLLALLLVLGIGVDYALFLHEDEDLSASTMLAILLSAVANELSFGVLSLSSTPAVRAFGLTVFIGVAGSALLAPLIVDLKTMKWLRTRA